MTLKRMSDQVLNETFAVEDAKACEELAKNLLKGPPPIEVLDSLLDDVHENLRRRDAIIDQMNAACFHLIDESDDDGTCDTE